MVVEDPGSAWGEGWLLAYVGVVLVAVVDVVVVVVVSLARAPVVLWR